MMFPERFEPGNLTESTKQNYISKCEGLKPIQDLTMMNFDDLGKIARLKTFPSFFQLRKKFVSKIFHIFLVAAGGLLYLDLKFEGNRRRSDLSQRNIGTSRN